MSEWCEQMSERAIGRILDEQILRFVEAVKRLFLSYIKYHNQKEKLFGYDLDCPLHGPMAVHKWAKMTKILKMASPC